MISVGWAFLPVAEQNTRSRIRENSDVLLPRQDL